MKEKISIILGVIIAAAAIITMGLYVVNIESIDLNEILLVLITGILIVFALYIIWDKLRNYQRGLPSKDERVNILGYKAGYYGFIAAIWSAVFGPLLVDILFNVELAGNYISALVVLCGGLVFAISYLVLSIKGTTV